MEDHYLNRGSDGHPKLKSVLTHRALTQHNVAYYHWSGRHDPPFPENLIERLKLALVEYESAKRGEETYYVNNYQFTPQSLAHIVDTLHRMGLTSLRVHRVYETLLNQLEFFIVLQKCGGDNAGAAVGKKSIRT